MHQAPNGPFRARRRRPPATAVATALLLVTGLLGTTAGLTLGAAPATAGAASAQAATAQNVVTQNIVTPGDFTGYGFDQCHAPDQRAMNRWLTQSPFLAVGIYISGNSRACRDQPNLTPQWISTQLAKGWRLLPITLGPQASCQPRFPRYQDDPKINPKRGTDGLYQSARDQGAAEAVKTVGVAQSLGIVGGQHALVRPRGLQRQPRRLPRVRAGVPLDAGPTSCTRSATRPASTPAPARASRSSTTPASTGPDQFSLPDQIWIARWDGYANTSTSYIRSDGWLPGGRMKQYQGGHDETWGGVRINIDRNCLDLGLGSVAARARRTAAGSGSATGATPHWCPARPPRWSPRCSACSRSRARTTDRSAARTTRPP